MKDKIIPMIIIMGFASFFVNDEDSFYNGCHGVAHL